MCQDLGTFLFCLMWLDSFLVFHGKRAQMLLAQEVPWHGCSACPRLPRGLLHCLMFLLLSVCIPCLWWGSANDPGGCLYPLLPARLRFPECRRTHGVQSFRPPP